MTVSQNRCLVITKRLTKPAAGILVTGGIVDLTFTSRFVGSGPRIFLRLGNDLLRTIRRNGIETVLGILR